MAALRVQVFRPKGATKDLLLIATERFRFCILSWDETTQQLVTLASGDSTERIGTLPTPCLFSLTSQGARSLDVYSYRSA